MTGVKVSVTHQGQLLRIVATKGRVQHLAVLEAVPGRFTLEEVASFLQAISGQQPEEAHVRVVALVLNGEATP